MKAVDAHFDSRELQQWVEVMTEINEATCAFLQTEKKEAR